MTDMTPVQALDAMHKRLEVVDVYLGWDTERDIIRAALSANGGEVVTWQFYQDGKWWNGDDRIKDHRANTEAAGIPIRELFTPPPPVAVPEEKGFADAPPELGNNEAVAWVNGYHQCRDDMLSAAPQPQAEDLTNETLKAVEGVLATAITNGEISAHAARAFMRALKVEPQPQGGGK